MLFNGMSYISAKLEPELKNSDLESLVNTAKDASETYYKMITETAQKAIEN
jgi:hypothetical protein